MTHPGGGYDPDDDPDIIEGVAREVDDDHEPRSGWFSRLRRRRTTDDPTGEDEEPEDEEEEHEPRRFSWKKLLFLALALVGAALLAFTALNSCGGGDSQSPGDTDSPTVVPTEVVTTPEPTASTATSTPTATSTSAVAVPTATVQADTGDPLGLTGGSSGSGGIVMFVLALLVAASCVWIFFRKTGPTA